MSSCKSYSLLDCRILPDTTIHMINIAGLDNKDIVKIIDILSERPIKIIGVNHLFADEMIGDTLLISALNKIENVVLASQYQSDKILYSPFSQFTHGVNYLNLNDGVVDRYYTSQNFNGVYSASFTFEMLKKIYPSTRFSPKPEISKIDFIGDLNCFYNYDASLILDRDDAVYWKDKIVLLGYLGSSDYLDRTEADDTDAYLTPLSSTTKIYGTVIHANILSAMIRKHSHRP